MAGADERKRIGDRRTSPRLPPSAIPALKGVKLVAGPEVKLINISRGGALIESDSRLAPGSNLCLRLVTAENVYLLRGRVSRSRVAALAGSLLRYQSALTFDEEFTILPAGQKPEAVEAAAKARKPAATTDQATTGTEPTAAQVDDSRAPAEPPEVFTVTVTCPDNDVSLRELLGRNTW
jgi:hypothetical protein